MADYPIDDKPKATKMSDNDLSDLRDNFALMAMNGLLAVGNARVGFGVMPEDVKRLAKASYAIADALIAERGNEG